MKLYLAGTESRSYLLDKENERINEIEYLNNINILESFYYLMKNPQMIKMVNKFGGFLLDSGAFTFMQSDKKIDWDKYIENYADFINKYDVQLFFELDIDGIIGLENVEKLRDRLQSLTGKYPIPVWHINRGKQYFIDMCRNYPYVALGGIAGAGDVATRKKAMKYFPWFINTAHENKAKIHGLGFTSVNRLKEYHFDSVDSTAWLYGNRSGYIYKFNKELGIIEKYNKKGLRLKSKESAVNNFNEWVKFAEYAERYL